MLIRIGTDKYHIWLSLLYYYEKQRIFNFIDVGITGLFFFSISTARPYLIIGKDYI